MKITYDPAKNATNIAERDLSFERVSDLDWDTAHYKEVTKPEHREKRFRALGFLDTRLHVLIYTLRKDGLRVISFRKANERERKQYEKEASRSLFH